MIFRFYCSYFSNPISWKNRITQDPWAQYKYFEDHHHSAKDQILISSMNVLNLLFFFLAVKARDIKSNISIYSRFMFLNYIYNLTMCHCELVDQLLSFVLFFIELHKYKGCQVSTSTGILGRQGSDRPAQPYKSREHGPLGQTVFPLC